MYGSGKNGGDIDFGPGDGYRHGTRRVNVKLRLRDLGWPGGGGSHKTARQSPSQFGQATSAE